MMKFTVVLTKDEDGKAYNASVPALPGCFTWGKTRASAYKNAREAIALYVEHLKATSQPIPEESGIKVMKVA